MKLSNETDITFIPRVCIAGNLLGRNRGYVTTQGQVLADLLAKDGYEVISVSSKVNRVLRLFEILWTILRRRRAIDVVVLEVYSGLAFVIADSVSILCRLLQIPTVFVLHGGNLPEFARSHESWCIRVLGRANILVAPSSFLVRKLAPYGSHIRVIPNIVSLVHCEREFPKNSSPKLLWMRSFHPIYNPQMALDAFAAIRLDLPDATLVMAGPDKGLETAIKASAREMGLEDSIRFPGFLDEKAKLEELSRADVYLNTNKIDNVPVSVIEACSMGVPVVATNIGGLSHLINHRENGLLVKDGDAAEMADAVRRLLKDRPLWTRISKNGQLLAKKFSWNTVRQDWEAVFKEIIPANPAKNEGHSRLLKRVSR